jgi:hypothetical protein
MSAVPGETSASDARARRGTTSTGLRVFMASSSTCFAVLESFSSYLGQKRGDEKRGEMGLAHL